MKHWRTQVLNQAFTLLELLFVVVIGGLAISATANVLVSQVRVTRNFYSSGKVQQDLSRLHRFLLAETQEACAFQIGSTSLNSCSASCVTSGFNELRLLIPITTNPNNDPASATNLRTIIYRISGNQLLRTGPRILSSGALDTATANDQTDTLVIDNVNTFTPTLSSDCNITTISIRLNVPGSTNTVPATGSPAEDIVLRAGTRIFN